MEDLESIFAFKDPKAAALFVIFVIFVIFVFALKWIFRTQSQLPVVIFHLEEFKEGLECAVCLCEVSDGEKARVLPKCNHGFHVDCIDMWFESHQTCPLCRTWVPLQLKQFGVLPYHSLYSFFMENIFKRVGNALNLEFALMCENISGYSSIYL